MHSAFLPDWLRVGWAVLLFGVAVAHAVHVITMSGQRRWWHVGHTVMAAGMMLMYLVPRSAAQVPYRAGLLVFAAIGVALVLAAVLLWRREGVLNPLWAASLLDTLAMTFMLLPMQARPRAVAYLFACYLVCSALAWVTGWWKRIPVLRGPAEPAPVAAGGGSSPRTAPSTTPRRTVGLTAECTTDVTVTLAVMSAGMAYMLAVM